MNTASLATVVLKPEPVSVALCPSTSVAGDTEVRTTAPVLVNDAVKVSGVAERLASLACARFVPAPSVHVTDDVPSLSVTVEVADSEPPPSTVQPTCAPLVGLPSASRAMTTSGCGSCAPGVPGCWSPETMVRAFGAPGFTVATTETDFPGSSLMLARSVSILSPATVPSVHVVAAVPSAFVVAASTATVPLLLAATNDTVIPGTGSPDAEVTFTVDR